RLFDAAAGSLSGHSASITWSRCNRRPGASARSLTRSAPFGSRQAPRGMTESARATANPPSKVIDIAGFFTVAAEPTRACASREGNAALQAAVRVQAVEPERAGVRDEHHPEPDDQQQRGRPDPPGAPRAGVTG